jgi:hypothetical protein
MGAVCRRSQAAEGASETAQIEQAHWRPSSRPSDSSVSCSIARRRHQGGNIASLVARFGPLGEAVIRIYTRQLLEGGAAPLNLSNSSLMVFQKQSVGAPHLTNGVCSQT